jgi:hypothetical protein
MIENTSGFRGCVRTPLANSVPKGRLRVAQHVPGFPVQLGGIRSLVRLSVKKPAYADLSRAACRKSGASAGWHMEATSVPQGRLKITQDVILGLGVLSGTMEIVRCHTPSRAIPEHGERKMDTHAR